MRTQWSLTGGLFVLGLLAFASPAGAQTTCDMNSPDFTECMQRRCAELQGRGRLCARYTDGSTAPVVSEPPLRSYTAPVVRAPYPVTPPNYIPLDQGGNILIRSPLPQAGYGYGNYGYGYPGNYGYGYPGTYPPGYYGRPGLQQPIYPQVPQQQPQVYTNGFPVRCTSMGC